MKKEDTPTFILFGIFYLREQIHNYLDVFCEYSYLLSRYSGSENAIRLFEGKQKMLRNSNHIFLQLEYADIQDPNLFEPLKVEWIAEKALENCVDNKDAFIQKFIDFNQSTMKWCYWFLSEEKVDLKTSQFLLEVISASKEEIELLSEVLKE